MTCRQLLLFLSMGIFNIVTCSEEVLETAPSPPLQFLTNPWHAVKMFLSPATSEKPLVSLMKKKNDLNILKSAYLYSKYAGAGRRLRKLEELKKALIENSEKEDEIKDPFFNLRNGWMSY